MTFTPAAARSPGEAIRERRQELGLSIFELATQTGIDPGHLSRAERGLAGVGNDYRQAIADALGVEIAVLFPDTTQDPECRSAASAADGAESATSATAQTRSPAPSVEGPEASASAVTLSTGDS